MKQIRLMKITLWSHAALAVVLLPSPVLSEQSSDLEHLARWQALIAANPCAPAAQTRLLQIHSLRDRLGDSPTANALRAAQRTAGVCRRTSELATELLARLDKRAGRFEQANQSYRDRGFLQDFLVAGPFDNESGTGANTMFQPERLPIDSGLDESLEMPGRGTTVRFRPLPPQAHAFGYNDFSNLWDAAAPSCGYAVSTLISARSGKGRLFLGASGAVAVWWNGNEVLRDSVERQAFPDRSEAPVDVRSGGNRVVVKICAEKRPGLGFYLRLTDKRGRPWSLRADPHASATGPADRARPFQGFNAAEAVVRSALATPRDAKAANDAAWYLLLTGGDDPRAHIGKDLATRACLLAPSEENCMAQADLALDRSERLTALLRAADAKPTAAVFARLARLALDADHLDEAQTWERRARAADPQSLDTRLLELDLLSSSGLEAAALERARQLLRSMPETPSVALTAFALSQRAELVNDRLWFAHRAAELAADEQEPVTFLARHAALVGDEKELENHLATLLALNGSSVTLREEAAWWWLGLGNPERAQALLETAVSQAPGSFDARLAFAKLLDACGKSERAAAEYAFASTLRPQDAELAEYLAAHGLKPASIEDRAVPASEFLSFRGKSSLTTDARLLVDQWAVEVLGSGLARRYRQIVVEILGPAAAQDWREHWIQSSATDQRVSILTARVHRKDGSTATGSPTAHVPVSEPWYRLYYDVEAQGIEMPSLQIGDVVEISYRIDDIAPRNELGGYFGDLVLIAEPLPKVLWRYSVTAPVSPKLHFNRPNVAGLVREDQRRGDLVTTVFEARDVPAIPPENGMPGPTSVMPYLHVSTYDSWDSLGKWYTDLVAPARVPDERLRNEVRATTKGLRDPRAKVAALYRYVVTNTRYVGLEFGIHGYEPYKAAVVAARGFGDCKDKANLLVTMLEDAGIDADIALVRTRHRGDLDTSIASLAAFDHAIAYVPSLDLWLDGTAEQYGFEELPFADQGVIALRLSRAGPILGRTPVLPAEKNRTIGRLELWLAEDGSAKLSAQVSTTGDTAAHLRRELETPHTRTERFEQLLSNALPGAKVDDLRILSLDSLDAPVSYSYDARLPAYATTTVEGILEIPVDQRQDMTKRFARLPQRSTALVVGPTGLIERKTIIHVPEGFAVDKTPPAVDLKTNFGSLRMEVSVSGSTITITRRVTLDVAEVSPDSYAGFSDFCRSVDQTLSERIVLRRMP